MRLPDVVSPAAHRFWGRARELQELPGAFLGKKKRPFRRTPPAAASPSCYPRGGLGGRPDAAALRARALLACGGAALLLAAPGVAYDAQTGMSYDGHGLDAETGELKRGPPPHGPFGFSAASKEPSNSRREALGARKRCT